MLDGSRDAEAHFDFFGTFVKNDYRLTNYELIYKTPSGEARAVRVSLTGIVQDGYLHRFWGAETNILDIKNTEAALDRQRRFQGLMTDVSSGLVLAQAAEEDKTVKGYVEKVCRYAGADRMTIFWLDADSSVARAAYTWGATDYPNRPALSPDEYPYLAEQIRAAQVVRVDDVDAMPEELGRDRATLQSTHVKSFLALPLIVGSDIVGVATLAHRVGVRSWCVEDVSELRVFAELFAN